MTTKRNETPVRIWTVIQFESLLEKKGCIPLEFAEWPLYEYIGNGVIKTNCGVKRSPETILFYDMTGASEEVKAKFSDLTIELEVKEILKEPETKTEPEIGDRIATVMQLTELYSTSLMDITGTYSSLSRKDLEALGKDFVMIESTPEGIKLTATPNLSDGYVNNLYLRIDPSLLEGRLLSRISSELTELILQKNGFYRLAEGESFKKDMN